MTGQPRKTVAKVKESERIDLAAVLGLDGGDPLPVTLGGVDAEIRRRYSGDEAVLFGTYAAENKFPEIFALVFEGDRGPKVWDQVSKMSTAHASEIINTIINHTGLFEGKLVAPLPTS